MTALASARDGYSPIIDATLDALTHLPSDDRKRLAIALLDQLNIRPSEQQSVAQLLGLIYEDGSVLDCWACQRLGEVIRTDAPAGFGRIACAQCDELERESWARRDAAEAFEAACDARRDESKDRQRIAVIR